MKIKKTVTEGVIEANRANSKLSTGPKTPKGKAASERNSLRHGILARAVFLDTDENRAAYHNLWQSWNTHFKPQNPLELLLVEEIANINWKLAIVELLETKELTVRQQDPDSVMGIFENSLRLPITALDLPLDHGYSCEKVVVRAVARDERCNASGTRQPAVIQSQWVEKIKRFDDTQSRAGGNLEVEAVLGCSLETLTRYGRTLRNHLYRAIREMRVLRGEEEDK